MNNVTIYTDGSCILQQGPGGWAAIFKCKGVERVHSGMILKTTSQRAEQIAIINALKLLKKPCNIELYTDSQYCVNTQEKNWKRNKNNDLWDEIDKLKSQHKIKFIHVKGHSNNEDNNRCDKLARMQSAKASILLQEYKEASEYNSKD